MADHDRPAQVPAIDVGLQEAGERGRDGLDLGGAEEVQEQEDGEDEGEGEGDEAGVERDGGEQDDDDGAVEDLATGVDLDVGEAREEEHGGDAEGEDEDPVGGDEEAGGGGAEDGIAEGEERDCVQLVEEMRRKFCQGEVGLWKGGGRKRDPGIEMVGEREVTEVWDISEKIAKSPSEGFAAVKRVGTDV